MCAHRGGKDVAGHERQQGEDEHELDSLDDATEDADDDAGLLRRGGGVGEGGQGLALRLPVGGAAALTCLACGGVSGL